MNQPWRRGGWESVPKNALREEGAHRSVPSLSSPHFTLYSYCAERTQG